jgi:hypothetical protein
MAPIDPQSSAANPENAKKDLSSWWKNFKRGGGGRRDDDRGGRRIQHEALFSAAANFESGESSQDPQEPQGIFGVPLSTSVRYANVAISLSDHNGQSYIYGYVPIVVAKCGVYLKEKGELSYSYDWKYF